MTNDKDDREDIIHGDNPESPDPVETGEDENGVDETDTNNIQTEEETEWNKLNQKIDKLTEKLENTTTQAQLTKIQESLEKLLSNPALSPEQKLEVRESLEETENQLQNLQNQQTPPKESTPKPANRERPARQESQPKKRVWI